MTEKDTIRIKPGDRKLLSFYKLEHDCKSYSEAIRHAIQKAEGIDGNDTQDESD